MIRTVIAVAAIALGSTAAVAQDPVTERQNLMKQLGGSLYGVMGRMVRGQDPYDQAKVDAAFAVLTQAAPKIKALYPESSKPKAPPEKGFYASAKVWENKADFDQWIVKVEQAVAANRSKATSLDGLKAAQAAVNTQCTGCHENYRLRVQ